MKKHNYKIWTLSIIAFLASFLLVFLPYKGCSSINSLAACSDNSFDTDTIIPQTDSNLKNNGVNLVEPEWDNTDEGSCSVLSCLKDNANDISIMDGVQLWLLPIRLLPAPLYERPEQILIRRSYVLSYNKELKLPNWVAWKLTADHVDGNAPRRNSFREDLDVPRPRATPADYKGSGWSRGHMCPSGDNKWDPQANHETFLLTNICPQNANLNSGLWNSIEMDCRKWAKKWGEVFIICGPLPLRSPYETIGDNKVAVPKAFFKIVLCLGDSPKAFGFTVKNRSGEKKNDLYYNSVREIERLTNIDFLPLLPDSIEDRIETHADMAEW